MKKRLLLILMLLIGTLATYSQNFGEFIVNSHISDANMQVLYDNCDSLNIVPVFHYFYSDDTLQNENSEIRRRHVSQGFLPAGMINGTPIATTPYLQNNLYNINAWVPLLQSEWSINFDVKSNIDVLNPEESVLNFELINLQNFKSGDIIQMALVEDLGLKHNVQIKMDTLYGIVYEGQKVIDVSVVWPSNSIIDNCNVVVWVEQSDKTVLFSKEFPIENEYINQSPVLKYELTTNGGETPTVLNWFFINFASSTDYEDDINGKVLQASIKWEDDSPWTLFEPINNGLFKYRFKNAGTYKTLFKIMDSNEAVVVDSTEITVDWMTGIKYIERKNVTIYPNPSNGNFTIMGDFIEEPILIYNNIGKEVYNNVLNSTINKINLELEKGTYFIKIKNEIQKIIVK